MTFRDQRFYILMIAHNMSAHDVLHFFINCRDEQLSAVEHRFYTKMCDQLLQKSLTKNAQSVEDNTVPWNMEVSCRLCKMSFNLGSKGSVTNIRRHIYRDVAANGSLAQWKQTSNS